MGALDDLKAAGFSDNEITGYATEKRQTLSSAGFSDQEINDHLGMPNPDLGGANKTFARTLGNALNTAKTTLAPAGQTLTDMGQIYPVIEGALNAGTGLLFGFPAYVGAGLGGLISKHVLGMDVDPKELAETMSKIVTYQPMTERGHRFAGNLMMPLEKIQEGSDWVGERAVDVTQAAGFSNETAAATGAITSSTLQMLAPILFGETVRKMAGQTISNADMSNTAKVIAGEDATPAQAAAVETSLRATYEKTGIGPFTVAEEAAKNPELRADLLDPKTEVPKALEPFVEKLPEPTPPVPGDGAPLLDVSGHSIKEAKLDTEQHPANLTEEIKAENNIGQDPPVIDAATLKAYGLDGETADNVALAARAVTLDKNAFAAAAVKYQHDAPGFIDAIKEIIGKSEDKLYPEGSVDLNAGLNPAAAIKGFADDYSPYVGIEQAKRKGSPLADALLKIFAPAARGPIAEQQAGIMRANFGEMARQREVALEQMKSIAATFDKMPVADNIKFIDSMERGATLDDPKLSDAALQLRTLLDAKREEVHALGKGQLENFDENYFPHIWKQHDEAQALFSNRPLEGSKSFLKSRTIPFTTDGLRWRTYDAEGDFVKSYDTEAQAQSAVPPGGRIGEPLTPITTNPVELAMLKAREMDKYIYGQKIFEEMKAAGLARFVRFGQRAAEGWTKINDKIARVYLPSDIPIREAYDKNMMAALNKFAEDIGVSATRGPKIAAGAGSSGARTWGWADRSGNVATKFGGPETVLTHELGHQLDFKYDLADQFVNDKATKGELRQLADLRYEGMPDVPDSFKSYVRKGTEKIANMVHAYVHIPERFKQVAPNTFAKFEGFLDDHPELSGLREIKPSLVLESNRATVNAGGPVIAGEYYAPDQAATLINNHLSPGLQGNGFFDTWRGIGMAMNSAQLGLSAFHVGFTTMDAMISKASLGVKQISRGDVLSGVANVAQGLNPAQPFINIYKGDRLLRAYLGKLDDPSLAPIVEAIEQAGGRVKMDDFYRNTTVNAFKQALRAGDKWGATKSFLPTVLDRTVAPIFEELVPRQKLGVFFDMAKDWLEQNPKADVETQRAGLGKLWDSVDNRMGQLVYDNVFWNRALKDGLMATVRSVGWNLGTFRELGGGVFDIKDIARNKGFSDRTAYVVALPMVAAVYGSMLGYLYTGKGPETLKDAFYPKTGKLRPDGTEDRVSLPTYMKDVFAYGEDVKNFAEYGSDPTQTIKNKAHPLISTVSQMFSNQDFFGGAIRNPSAPATQQIMDEAHYLIQQIMPFSLRNYQQQAKTKGEEPTVMGYLTSPSMIGVTPAPGYIVKSPEEEASTQISRLRDPLMKKFRQEIKDGANVDKIIPQMIAAGLSRKDIKFVIKTGGDTPLPHKMKHFGTVEETEE